mmetsp:Transcript_21986/g.63051  ORF Transcript_21986/g.63051 Transcript_21986/m.63051 type:complete len:557 (+) Transcript_21986:69-1739(+)
MKRRSESDASLRHLKRANSSVFSIATIVHDTSNEQEGGDEATRTDSFESQTAKQIPVVGKPLSQQPSQSPLSLEMAGFFVESGNNYDAGDGDGNDDDSGCGKGDTLDTSSYLPVLSPSRKAKKSPFADDNATGVIFESSDGHYDRINRLHKERPLRITSVSQYLTRPDAPHNIAQRCKIFGDANVVYKREVIDGTIATSVDQFLDDDDYLRVHLAGHMQRLDCLSGCSCTDRLDREAEQYQSIYFASGTVSAAKNATSSLCRLVSDVVAGKLDNGFAVIRPPGHHASPSLAGGYCYINNVAVAAAYARERLGVAKTLIVDWDVHHGNGTQSIFLNDPDVLYFSVHRYHNGNYFPFLGGNGGPGSVGTGEGAGFNINVGWNQKSMGDEEYYAVWSRVLLPVVKEFRPDLILVSAGFDGALGDMGEQNVTPTCFANLARQLMPFAEGRIVCTLEGGYVRSVLGKCCEAVILSLLRGTSRSNGGSCGSIGTCADSTDNVILDDDEEKKVDSDGTNEESTITTGPTANKCKSINPSADKSIQSTIASHASYWKCFAEASN